MLGLKKGQMIGLDIIVSILILLLAIGLVYYFIMSPERRSQQILELEESFFLTNFKNNLHKNPAYNFLDGYKVNEAKLSAFASLPDSGIKRFMLEDLGINNESYDMCLFFEDSGEIIPVNGKDMLGEVYSDEQLINRIPCDDPIMKSNPCEYYQKIINILMPVLKTGKIIRLHIVVCKIR